MQNPYYTSAEYRQPGSDEFGGSAAFVPGDTYGGGGGNMRSYFPQVGYANPLASSSAGGAGWTVSDIFGTDPTTQPFATQWTKAMGAFNQPAPRYGDIEGLFRSLTNQGTSPELQHIIGRLANYKSRATAAANPYSKYYEDEVKSEVERLKQDPMTAADDAALRARYLGGNAYARDTANKRMAEQAAARGLGPTSGPTLAALAEVEKAYGLADAQGRQALYEYVTNERERRRAAAQGYAGNLAQFGEGAANRGTQVNLANESARLQALVSSGQMSLQAAQQQYQNLLAGASGMANLRRQEYSDALAQQLQALNIAAMPRTMAQQEQASLYAMLNGLVPSQQSVANQYGDLLNGQVNSDARQAAYWQNLFQQIGYGLPGVLGGMSGGGQDTGAGALPSTTNYWPSTGVGSPVPTSALDIPTLPSRSYNDYLYPR
jgi:hypothetical protein